MHSGSSAVSSESDWLLSWLKCKADTANAASAIVVRLRRQPLVAASRATKENDRVPTVSVTVRAAMGDAPREHQPPGEWLPILSPGTTS
jgi:hypothetical protein